MSVPLPSEVLIRPAASDAEAALSHNFYKQNPHANVRERDFEDLSKAVMDGLVALAIDTASHEWLGVCAAFYKKSDDYAEVGGSQCLLTGFGLQKLLIASCALTSYELRPPKVDIFAITGVNNSTTQRNMIDCGITLSSIDQALEIDGEVAGFDPTQKVLHRFESPPPHLCRDILKAAINRGTLARAPHTIRLRIELPVIEYLKRAGQW